MTALRSYSRRIVEDLADALEKPAGQNGSPWMAVGMRKK
jgi:hypothetical protein